MVEATEHAKRFLEANWSFAIANSDYKGDPKDLQPMSDFDSLAIGAAMEQRAQNKTGSEFLFLEDYTIDLDNSYIWPRNSPNYMPLKLIKTKNNDRRRCDIESGRSHEMSSKNAHSTFFAVRGADFGGTWYEDNNKK